MRKFIKSSIILLLVMTVITGSACIQANAETELIAISTEQDLIDIKNNLSGDYYLASDILLKGNWQPIEGVFNGSLDGKGRAIIGTAVSAEDELGAIFKETSESAVIENIAIIEFNVSAKNAGGIVYTNRGTIRNSYTTNRMNSDISGGIAYENYGIIQNCFNAGIMKCDNIGGIAYKNYGTILNCYTSANIYGDEVAAIAYDNPGTVQNCYYSNAISKGVISGNDDTVKLDYFQMRSQNSFEGFNFESVWTMRGNSYFPYPQLVGNTFFGVYSPEPDNVVYISDEKGLYEMRNNMFSSYELINDIDVNENWQTIPGTFKGQFNGNGYSIKGLNSSGPLFEVIGANSTVENIAVSESNISGENVGGIAVENKGTIQKCFTDVNISATGDAAGLVYSNSGVIKDSYTKSHIVSENSAGIAVENSGTIKNCFNIGQLESTVICKGLVISNSGNIDCCYYSNKYTDSYGQAVSSSQLKNQATFKGFDFKNVWTMRDYPMFTKFWSTPEKENISVDKVKYLKLKNDGKRKVTVSWKKIAGCKGYEVHMSLKKAGKYKVTNTSKTRLIKKNLRKGKTYYFKVRGYKKDSNGIKVYGKFSSIKKVKIKK